MKISEWQVLGHHAGVKWRLVVKYRLEENHKINNGQLPARQICPRTGRNHSTCENPHEEGCGIRLKQAAEQSLPANEGLYHEWQNTSLLRPSEGNHSSGGRVSARARKVNRLPMHQSHLLQQKRTMPKLRRRCMPSYLDVRGSITTSTAKPQL